MPAPTLVCPECQKPVAGDHEPDSTVVCASCGAVAREGLPLAGEVDDATEDADREPDDRGEEAWVSVPRREMPEWVWTVGPVLIGLALTAVWVAVWAGRGPKPPAANDAATAGADEAPTPGGGPGFRSPFADAAEPASPPRPAAATPPALADTLFLLPDDSPPAPQAGPDRFERELARQALWLSGREEFALRVRDSALGDAPPDGLPADRQFRFRGVPLNFQARSVPAGGHEFWQGPLVGYVYTAHPALCLAAYEELTRGFFARCLTAAGHAPAPKRTSDAPVPADVAAALDDLREAPQFAAVRRLHDEIRTRGESDALVGGLVRGYANLALLTEFHWSPAPFVFKARALLYAQRLVARAPLSPTALRLRAYAAALAGLHGLAITDLSSASNVAGDADAPPWVEAVDAFARFDLDRLADARAKADAPLVRLLQYLAAEAPEAQAATVRAGRAALARDPACFRVHDGLCRVGGVAHQHGATADGPAAFAKELPRLADVPGLPIVAARALAGGSERTAYNALRAAAADDRGEPSWAALGGLYQEVRFTQAWHRLTFLATAGGGRVGRGRRPARAADRPPAAAARRELHPRPAARPGRGPPAADRGTGRGR